MSSRVISTFRLSAILAATTSSTDMAGSWRAPHSRSVRYLCKYRQAFPNHLTFSDRYVIRTRNLQDWNLTRYRCANRSVEGLADAAAARVDGALLAAGLARPALAVAAGVDLALLRALVVAARDDGERRRRRLRRHEGLRAAG